MDNQDQIQNNQPSLPSSQVLPAGYQLDDYIIEKEIGAGGFGVTYKAYDQQLNRHVAIKEYFPFNLAARDSSMHVSPKTRVAEDVDEYSWGLSRFIQEARTLALFEHTSIIRVIRFIERNSTAYIIMDFADGRDVSDVIQNDGLLSVANLKKIILPIAEGLVSVHAADMLHRDIKPGNIRVRSNGTAVLIDFGAARQAIGVRSQSISTILTPGYAPIEQYSTRGHQGPWTDIYSLAAVAYVCLTGENLSHFEAADRIRNDKLPKLVDRIKDDDTVFLSALDWGLSPEEADRPQTVQELLDAINSGVFSAQQSQVERDAPTIKVTKEDIPVPQRKPSSVGEKGKKKQITGANIAVLFGVCIGLVMLYMASNIGKKDTSSEMLVNAAPDKVETAPIAHSATKKQQPTLEKQPRLQVSSVPRQSSKQDDIDFLTASKINTPEAFEIYTRLHPNGRHRQKIVTRRR